MKSIKQKQLPCIVIYLSKVKEGSQQPDLNLEIHFPWMYQASEFTEIAAYMLDYKTAYKNELA